MEKAMTITYKVHDGLYINMTNRCSCACTFCLRQNAPGVYGSDPLWLQREPTVDEVVASVEAWDFSALKEIVFCGYGEPTERLDDLLAVAKAIKAKHDIPIRINTNGHADLINSRRTAPELKGLIDTVSVSLNANDAETYLTLTRSRYGIGSWQAMLDFTRDCTAYVPTVMMTVVDQVTSPEEQQTAKEIAESVGAKLRVRPFES